MFHPFTGEIYGAQAVGKEELDKRIDVIAMVIQRGMTIKGNDHFLSTYRYQLFCCGRRLMLDNHHDASG